MYTIYIRLKTNEVLTAFTWNGNPDAGVMRAAYEALEHNFDVEDIWYEVKNV
jgi:hypothetical protein